MFPLLIFLVALALGLEHFLANRFYRRTDLPPLRKSLAMGPGNAVPEVPAAPPELQATGASDT